MFYPPALQGSGVLSSLERAGGRQGRQAPLALSRPQFFTDHFQTCQGDLLPQDLGTDVFFIHGHIFQVKTIKFVTNSGLYMLFNLSSGSYHNWLPKSFESVRGLYAF